MSKSIKHLSRAAALMLAAAPAQATAAADFEIQDCGNVGHPACWD